MIGIVSGTAFRLQIFRMRPTYKSCSLFIYRLEPLVHRDYFVEFTLKRAKDLIKVVQKKIYFAKNTE